MKIIDLHCDTIAKLMESGEAAGLAKNSLCVDTAKLRAGEALAQFFAIYIDGANVENLFVGAKQMAGRFYEELAKNQSALRFAGNAADLRQNELDGKISAFLTIEEGGALQGKIENLQEFYQLGVRLITLTWNYPNEIGYPNYHYEHQRQGLTSFGKTCVAAMNELGMIVDVSHLSDQGFYDVAAITTRPFVASHSNSRAICPHYRNLTDAMIRRLAERGGVIGLNFAAYFLGVGDFGKIEDMVRHIQHIHQVGGVDTIALGSDFDGIDQAAEIEDFGQMQKIIGALRQSGFSETEIEKFAWRNARRVIADCLR